MKLTPELQRLGIAIASDRHKGRIDNIREAWAVYLKTLEKPEPWWKRLFGEKSETRPFWV